MKDRGALIAMVLGLLLIILYFSMFGFSYDTPTRMGQYAAIGAVVFFIFDEATRS